MGWNGVVMVLAASDFGGDAVNGGGGSGVGSVWDQLILMF